MGISLKCLIPNGIPIIVRQQSVPISALTMLAHIPTSKTQATKKPLEFMFFAINLLLSKKIGARRAPSKLYFECAPYEAVNHSLLYIDYIIIKYSFSIYIYENFTTKYDFSKS